MSTPRTPSEDSSTTPPDWDLSVLDTPVILDIPDHLPEHPEPFLIDAIEAMVAALLKEPSSSQRLADLALTGVVALDTSSGCLEIHETLLGWTLSHAAGTPDPHNLATAARLRAHRLAGERRHHDGAPQ